jgi:hypothetical protein
MFGLFEQNMELSHIHLAVLASFWKVFIQFGWHGQKFTAGLLFLDSTRGCQLLQKLNFMLAGVNLNKGGPYLKLNFMLTGVNLNKGGLYLKQVRLC